MPEVLPVPFFRTRCT